MFDWNQYCLRFKHTQCNNFGLTYVSYIKAMYIGVVNSPYRYMGNVVLAGVPDKKMEFITGVKTARTLYHLGYTDRHNLIPSVRNSLMHGLYCADTHNFIQERYA